MHHRLGLACLATVGAGRVWRVVYTENAVADNAFKLQSQTKAKEGAPGTYFPGTMINSFQPDSATFVMGVYSGHWLHLKMTGASPCSLSLSSSASVTMLMAYVNSVQGHINSTATKSASH